MTKDFLSLGVGRELYDVLEHNGITTPTDIQSQAIPVLMAGNDVVAQAQTGTGKTLAFLLPIMEHINKNRKFTQALIITPTRELALQITAVARKLAAAKGINILPVYGGQDIGQQLRKLKGTIHMLIGTPGRLLDHLKRKTIDLSKISMLVLDEADQMLDMGFLKDVEQIITKTPESRQTMLFSATISKEIRSLSAQYMKDPVNIKVQGKNITLEEIRQLVVETTDRAKQDLLCRLIEEYKPFMAIIFCRTKRRASALNSLLQRRGYNSGELHGDMTQAKREKVMRAFRETKLKLLVATDVAARGLDIEGVTHVFNYDIPQDVEYYIHRIGRTGRAGQSGIAITLATSRDRDVLRLIEKSIRMPIERLKMGKDPYKGEYKEQHREQAHKGQVPEHEKAATKSRRRPAKRGFAGTRGFGGKRSSGGKASGGAYETNRHSHFRKGKPSKKPAEIRL